MSTATIRRIDIKRFRGVRSLSWRPNPRLNIILGAADGGKSTVLEAIALLFSSAPNFGLSEFDYHNRDIDAGFSIEAVVSVGNGAFLRDEGFPAPPLQGWLNGKLTDLPDEDGAGLHVRRRQGCVRARRAAQACPSSSRPQRAPDRQDEGGWRPVPRRCAC